MSKLTWIAVEERLPEDNTRIIICSLDAINDYAYPYDYEDSCEMGFYENGKWYSDTIADNISAKDLLERCEWQDIEYVTHWMPLPPKP